uniref:Uncharacterized protein n=1 Tax=Eutreptiella gymnastica TaxID=73025 RepID=A0A7S4FSM6_9EUGL
MRPVGHLLCPHRCGLAPMQHPIRTNARNAPLGLIPLHLPSHDKTAEEGRSVSRASSALYCTQNSLTTGLHWSPIGGSQQHLCIRPSVPIPPAPISFAEHFQTNSPRFLFLF